MKTKRSTDQVITLFYVARVLSIIAGVAICLWWISIPNVTLVESFGGFMGILLIAFGIFGRIEQCDQ